MVEKTQENGGPRRQKGKPGHLLFSPAQHINGAILEPLVPVELPTEYKHMGEPSQHHLEERQATQLSSAQIAEP